MILILYVPVSLFLFSSIYINRAICHVLSICNIRRKSILSNGSNGTCSIILKLKLNIKRPSICQLCISFRITSRIFAFEPCTNENLIILCNTSINIIVKNSSSSVSYSSCSGRSIYNRCNSKLFNRL